MYLKIFELNEKKREDRIDEMKNIIMKERHQVQSLIESKQQSELIQKGRKIWKTQTYPEEIVKLSFQKFPLKSTEEEIQSAELVYGNFKKISTEQRRYDKKLNRVILEIKQKDHDEMDETKKKKALMREYFKF